MPSSLCNEQEQLYAALRYWPHISLGHGSPKEDGEGVSTQVMGQAAGAIDFIVIHSYPLWDVTFDHYADGKVDLKVRAAANSTAVRAQGL